MDLFVGRGRQKIVDDLIAVFVRTRDGDGSSRWHSIEAPTGVGKTRILQEFYSRLSRDFQERPPYWPSQIVKYDTYDARLLEIRRKQIYPQTVRKPSRAIPKWLWWGLVASQSQGIQTDSIAESLGQLEAHGPHLQDAAVKRTGIRRKMTGATSRQKAKDLAVQATLEFAQVAAGTSIPVVTIGALISKYSLNARNRSRERRLRMGPMVLETTSNQEEAVDDAVALLRQMGQAHIPTILAIEDLHFAGSTFQQLIERILLDPDTRTLIISTSWAGYLDDQHLELCDKLDTTEARTRRIIYGHHPDFQPLSEPECTRLLHEWAPNLTAGIKHILCGLYNTPLALRKITDLRGIISRLEKSSDPRSVIDSLPGDLYELAWKEFESPLQLSLALAAKSTPGSMHDLFRDEDRWDGAIADRAIRKALPFFELEGTDTEFASPDDAIPFGWVEESGDGLRRFLDQDQRAVASRHADFHLTDHEYDQYVAMIAQSIARHLPVEVQGERDVVHVASHLSAIAAGISECSHSAVIAGTSLVRFLFLSYGENRILLRILRSVVEMAGVLEMSRTSGVIELRLIELMFEMDRGSPETIQRMLSSLEEDIKGIASTNRRLQWAVRRLRLRDMRSRGHLQEACMGFEQLYTEIESDPDAHRSQILEISNDLAFSLGRLGQPTRAAVVFEEMLASQVPGDMRSRSLLRRQHDLASVLRRGGSLHRAAGLLEDVLSAQEGYLGKLDPDTLHSLQLLGAIRRDIGQLAEAERHFVGLLECRQAAFGMNHQDTLIAFGHMVWLLRRQLRLDRALPLAIESHDRRKKLLGDDHPVVYDSGRVLTAVYRLSGEYDEALRTINPILRHIQQTLDDIEPVRLQTELAKARVLSESGDHRVAEQQLLSIRSRQRRILEADHIDSLSLEYYLLDCGIRMGKGELLVTASRTLLQRLIMKTYQEHPEVLRMRLLLGRTLAQSGAFEESQRQITTVESAASGRIDVDHEIWRNLANCRDQYGVT